MKKENYQAELEANEEKVQYHLSKILEIGKIIENIKEEIKKDEGSK